MRRYFIFISALFFLFVNYYLSPSALIADETDSLLQVIDKQKNSAEKVDNLNRLAFNYRSSNKDSAIYFADQAIALANSLDYQEGIANANYMKSIVCRRSGDYNSAEHYAVTALSLAREIGDSATISKSLYTLGIIYGIKGETRKAITYYREVLKAYRQNDKKYNMLAVCNAMGQLFNKKALYDSAAIYLNMALELNEEVGNISNKSRILGNLGEVYRMLEKFEVAEDYLQQSVSLCIDNPEMADNLGTVYGRLGSVFTQQKRYRDALEYFRKSDSVYNIISDLAGLHNNLVNTANIYTRLEKYDLARNNYKLALQYYRLQDYKNGLIVTWQGLANMYYARGLLKQATLYYDSSLSLAIQAGYQERQQDLLDNMYVFYSDIGDYKNALQYHERLKELEDSLFNEDKAFIIDDLRLKYETTQKEIENLKQKNEILRIKKQRNSFIYTVFGIIILAFYLIVYFRTKHRKNKIIAEQKIKQLEEEKKLLAARFLVEGQEKERKRIATAIHDSLGVLLSASKMHVTAIKDNSPETKALIDKATKFLDDASGEMRKISHNMMPGLLTKMGLCEALEDLFENISDTKDIDAKVDVIGPKSDRLPENHEIMIYRVVQEMVNNTLKHAKANKIDLVLVLNPSELSINYSDNGVGFDVDTMIQKKSLGIQSIQSRISFLDGQVNIQSSQGKGTVYRIQIPLPGKK